MITSYLQQFKLIGAVAICLVVLPGSGQAAFGWQAETPQDTDKQEESINKQSAGEQSELDELQLEEQEIGQDIAKLQLDAKEVGQDIDDFLAELKKRDNRLKELPNELKLERQFQQELEILETELTKEWDNAETLFARLCKRLDALSHEAGFHEDTYQEIENEIVELEERINDVEDSLYNSIEERFMVREEKIHNKYRELGVDVDAFEKMFDDTDQEERFTVREEKIREKFREQLCF